MRSLTMEPHYYADAELPFHVWVRESADGKPRWVLRDASDPARRGADSPKRVDPPAS